MRQGPWDVPLGSESETAVSSARLHRLLLVSDVPLAKLLVALLQAEDREIDSVESYGRYHALYAKLSCQAYDVVVLTNTTLTPKLILQVTPEIQWRFPAVSIVVLSGVMADDLAARLASLGIHDVFEMPNETFDAVRRIREILARKNPAIPTAPL